jgi:hypothetical protein
MKKLIIKATIVFVVQLNFAQAQQDIVNGDFEFWDTIPGTNGLEDPIGWTSNNFVVYNCTTGVYTPGISKSTDAYSGQHSLKFTPTGNPFANYSSIVFADTNCQFNMCYGFNCDNYPVTYVHQKIVGYYKFHPESSVYDTANIYTSQIHYDSITGIPTTARSGLIWFTPAMNWTYFEVPIGYNTFIPMQGEVFYISINLFSNDTSTDPQGFLLIDSLAIVPEIVTGLANNNKNKLKFSPNPVQKKLVIESSASFNNFELCDLSGRIIKSGPFEKEMDVDFLRKGIYFLRLFNENEILAEKFMKE